MGRRLRGRRRVCCKGKEVEGQKRDAKEVEGKNWGMLQWEGGEGQQKGIVRGVKEVEVLPRVVEYPASLGLVREVHGNINLGSDTLLQGVEEGRQGRRRGRGWREGGREGDEARDSKCLGPRQGSPDGIQTLPVLNPTSTQGPKPKF